MCNRKLVRVWLIWWFILRHHPWPHHCLHHHRKRCQCYLHHSPLDRCWACLDSCPAGERERRRGGGWERGEGWIYLDAHIQQNHSNPLLLHIHCISPLTLIIICHGNLIESSIASISLIQLLHFAMGCWEEQVYINFSDNLIKSLNSGILYAALLVGIPGIWLDHWRAINC